MKTTSSIYQRTIETPRREIRYQPAKERLGHFEEFRLPVLETEIQEQAGRCMTCGIPFCHNAGCPLGNPVPEMNNLVFEGRWREACDLWHAYNNFPEFTGRLCPALCEASCVHGLNDESVMVREIEFEVVERGWHEGWITPLPPKIKTDKKVAVIGSGPAGLTAAQQLCRAGHSVIVFEKDDLPGGILRYGIPDFKIEKRILDRRLDQLHAEGVRFETNVTVGEDISPHYMTKQFDAVVLAGGAMQPRDLDVTGREIPGIHFAMEYLVASNHAVRNDKPSRIGVKGLDVIILGGGDTGADCLGTALRQGAKSVTQLEIMPKPPEKRNPENPWPRWPNILRTGTSHKEGGERRWNVSTKRFLSENENLVGVECVDVDWVAGKPVEKGPEYRLRGDIVLLALGFVHPKHDALLRMFDVKLDERGNVQVDPTTMATSQAGIFSAGDMQSGASLVVRAIRSGRMAARGADEFLMGQSDLPAVY